MATTFTNEPKSSTLFGNIDSQQFLSIGDGFSLLIDSTYKLEIQSAGPVTTWTNEAKN